MDFKVIWMSSLLITGFTLAPLARAQENCHAVFSNTPSASTYEATQVYILKEFNYTLNEATMKLLHRVVNEGRPLKHFGYKEKKAFKDILKELNWFDIKQKKSVEKLIGRKLSPEEATALKFARGLGRTEPGSNPELHAFSGNYTKEQIERKDRVLQMSGFSFEERMIIQTNKFLEDSLVNFAAESLVADNDFTPEQAKIMNKLVMEEMQKESLKLKVGVKSTVEKKEAKEIYEAVTRHPVARILNVNKYDPTHEIGFCFGRAMAAYFEALSRGIHKDSIRNVFVVGHMKAINNDTTWAWHVVKALKASDGGWWIIDPFFGKVVKLEEWHEQMSKQDLDGNMRLYATDSSRFLATSSFPYNNIGLLSDYYNGYFKDLVEYYRKKAGNEAPPKTIWIKMMDKILSLLKIGV